MQKPIILVFATSYRPFVGGAELAVENITKRLGDNFKFYILTARNRLNLLGREEGEEITIVRLGVGNAILDKLILPFAAFFWALRFVLSVKFLRQDFKNRKIIFWGVMVSYASIGAWFLKWFFPRIPFVLTIQEGDEEWKFKWRTLGLSVLWWRLILTRVNFVTVLSRYLLDVVREHGYRGKAEVVPNGVDEKFLEVKPVTSESDKVIFSASRLVRKNGLDLLIKACGLLKNDFNFRIILAGDGPEKESLEKISKEVFIEDRVKFLGNVSYDRLPALYREVDIFVRPSRTEGLGSAFLEAMAAGAITIGTKVGGTSDFLKDGVTGFAVPREDISQLKEAIRTALLLTPKKREEMVENARRMVRERFLWARVAEKMGKIFTEVTNMLD